MITKSVSITRSISWLHDIVAFQVESIFIYKLLSFILATSADYKLLETLNKCAVGKYTEMSATTTGLIDSMENINERCKV